MSVGVLTRNGAGKIHMSETTGIERLGSFLAGVERYYPQTAPLSD